jgi:hypothetical protein
MILSLAPNVVALAASSVGLALMLCGCVLPNRINGTAEVSYDCTSNPPGGGRQTERVSVLHKTDGSVTLTINSRKVSGLRSSSELPPNIYQGAAYAWKDSEPRILTDIAAVKTFTCRRVPDPVIAR